MTTRLNNGTVQMTNFLINFISSREILGKDFLSKVDHLLANWFFVNKKRIDSFKNGIELKVRNSPKDLVSALFQMTFIQKMKLSSKSLRCPIKEGRFGVVALNLRSVGWCFSSLLHSFIYVQRAFGINITSEISKVVDRRNYRSSNGFNVFFKRRFYDSMPIFQILHSIEGALFSFFFKVSRGISKVEKRFTFIRFFHQKWKNFRKSFISFFAENKMKRWNPVFLFRNFRLYRPFKVGVKPLYIVLMGRNDRKSVLVERRSFDSANIKAAIPIYITCGVSEFRFLHA